MHRIWFICECLRSVCKLHRVGECNVGYNCTKKRSKRTTATHHFLSIKRRTSCLFLSPTQRRKVAPRKKVRGASRTRRFMMMMSYADELNINPPTPCQIGKRPPAPKPKRESAGHQGVAGGGYRTRRFIRAIGLKRKHGFLVVVRVRA